MKNNDIRKILMALMAVGFICFTSQMGNAQTLKSSLKVSGLERLITQDMVMDEQGNQYVAGYYDSFLYLDGQTLHRQVAGVNDDVLNIFIAKLDSSGSVKWLQSSTKDNLSLFNAISNGGVQLAYDPAGHVYLSGIFESTVDFGNDSVTNVGEQSIFLAKFDTSGSLQNMEVVAESFFSSGGLNNDNLVTDGQGNVYLAGTYSNQNQDSLVLGNNHYVGNDFIRDEWNAAGSYLIKYDAAGNIDWSGLFQSKNLGEYTASAAVGATTSGVYLSGFIEDTIVYGMDTLYRNANKTAHLTKVDENGNLEWWKPLENQSQYNLSQINALVDGLNGKLYLGGRHADGLKTRAYFAKISKSGEIIWEKAIGSNSSLNRTGQLAFDPNDPALYIGGNYELDSVSQAYRGLMLGKYDTAGNAIRHATFGNTSQNSNNTIVGMGIHNNHVYCHGEFGIGGFYFNNQQTLVASDAPSGYLIKVFFERDKCRDISLNPQFDYTEVCKDDTVSFTNQTTTNDSVVEYTWFLNSGQDTLREVAPEYVFNSSQAEVILQAEVTNGCKRAVTQSLDLIPDPEPDFTYSEVCVGDTVEFTNTTTSEDSIVDYQWHFNQEDTFNQENPEKPFDSVNNEAQLMVISQAGCTGSITKDVNLVPKPISEFSYEVLADGNVDFTAENENLDTYKWEFGDSYTSDQPSPTYPYGENGEYDVTLTTERDECNEASQTSKTINIDNITSIEEQRIKASLKVYPSPFQEEATIQIELAKSERIKVEIYGPTGKLIKKLDQGKQPTGVHEVTFNSTATLKQGIYYFHVQIGEDQVVESVMHH